MDSRAGVALRDAAGNPVRMAGSHVDLSDRKLAEADLLSAQIRAAKFEAIGTLAAGVAHEVKNPLQTIVMGLDYLERRLPAAPAEARAVLQDMRQAMTRANSIVRELLCFAATPRIELQPEDWNALVESSLALLHFEIAASQTALDLRLADGLPPVRVNRQKIQQIFVNLVLNALQAMPAAGRLSLITRLITADADLSRSHPACREFKPGIPLVLTQILDNGPGIAPEHLPRVFDPFFTTKPVGEGTGLGLAVVKKIVELHDGAIDIRNARQGGTLVTLILRAEPKAQL
ncbi:MAG TPA: ATP-binding protein [Verrucomicrobiota bacterium]|nr:ATP-binding protein [Verrucomicrobiota bacterium]